jgi:hypothetical protein
MYRTITSYHIATKRVQPVNLQLLVIFTIKISNIKSITLRTILGHPNGFVLLNETSIGKFRIILLSYADL